MRNYKMDNIRFVLIFLVVFGHVMIRGLGGITFEIYNVIYSFHMPAFIFITGYFASFKPKKILLSLLWPYLLMQILVFIFRYYALNQTKNPFSLIKPEYTLWYLLISALYYLLIPLIKTSNNKKKIVFMLLSLALSLIAGYVDKLGYELTLARFFCFMPFFVCGFYLRNTSFSEKFSLSFKKAKIWIIPFTVAFVVFAEAVILNTPKLTNETLHGAFSYEYSRIEWYHRLFLILTAFAIIVLLFNFIPDKKIKFVSEIGKNTFPIYITHGILVQLLRYYGVLVFPLFWHIIAVFFVTLILLVALGNDYVGNFFSTILTGNWILKLKHRKEA